MKPFEKPPAPKIESCAEVHNEADGDQAVLKNIDGVAVTHGVCGPQASADCKDPEDPGTKALNLLKADPENSAEQWQVKEFVKPPAPKIEACAAEIECEDIPLDEQAYESAW